MADAEVRPFVVQRPNDPLAAAHNLVYPVEREHPLIDPMQVDDVCLLELAGAGDVDACVGNVCLPKMGKLEVESSNWQLQTKN